MPTYLPFIYLPYIVVAVTLTIVLARVLARHGGVFLASVFPDQPQLATAVNQLLVVGFYLANLGGALLNIAAAAPLDAAAAIETFATKVGALLVILAAVHFANLIVFHRIRVRHLAEAK